MSLLRRALARAPQTRGAASPTGPGDPWAIPSNGSLAAVTPAGVQVTDDTAMQLLAVAACVRILSQTVAGLPLNAVRMRGDLRETMTPAPPIVADPFGGASSTALLSRRAGLGQMMVSLLLRGNAYAQVLQRDYLLRPSRLRLLHPDRVRCQFNGAGERVYWIDRKPADAEDMVHLMGMAFPESPTGMSVISYARNTIGLGLAAESFGAGFFGRGAHMSGVISVEGDLDKGRARQMKESFESSHSGLTNAHAVGVLSGGAKWTPISVTPEDAQFLGTRAAQNLDVAMLFGLPPHMLGQVDRTTSWGTGIEQQGLGFLRYTLAPWLGTFEDAWSMMLPRPQAAWFDADGLLRTDTAGRWAVYQIARNIAGMTPDEIRARENMPPLPDGAGTDPFAPLNSAHTTDPGWTPGEPDPKLDEPVPD
ncbi:phage portal protein [Streptomyces lydicus]|uniref:phage portal protein n=1 Tax=Streptomyces lydicus TaxID=47763 RepID=UPI0010103389|nr:phage portal protein [Streptomyces lydicus]MCZ1006338.1 phage portal protein [Streptomyces lydicus]